MVKVAQNADFRQNQPRKRPRWAPVGTGEILKMIEKVQGDIFEAPKGVFFYQFLVSEPDIYGKMC